MKKALLYIWQLPQNLIGIIFKLLYKKKLVNIIKHNDYELGDFYYGYIISSETLSGISLGNYIFIGKYFDKNTINHEIGHHKQSIYLGPIYLLVIGIPSLIGNIIDRLFHNSWSYEKCEKWYYNLPWEKWADKLGKVKRYYPTLN